MSTIASLLVSLKTDFGDTRGKINEVHDAFDEAGQAAEDAGEKVDRAGKKAKESEGDFSGLQEQIKKLGEEMLKFGTEALAVGSVFEVLKESMEVSAEIESVTVAMTEFTGSASAAADEIEQLESIAHSEALKFPEVLPAAQHFMALGFSAEQTTRTIQVAGNAAWALGTSVESVTQRMGMMAMGGQVSGRFLRSLGISLEDLAGVMGITGKSTADLEDKVRRAFKFEDEEARLGALQAAMDKFGSLGAKEAETLSGKWIEFKNTSHEAFATLGDDLTPIASIFLSLGTFANEATSALLNMLDPLKDIKDTLDGIGHTKGMLTLQDLMSKENKQRQQANAKDVEVSAFSTRPVGPWEGQINQETLDKTTEAAMESNKVGSAIMPKFKPHDIKPTDVAGIAVYAKQESDAKKSLAESDAAQEYTRNKTRIDSDAASAKAMVELWKSANAAYLATGKETYSEALANSKFYNDQELAITLDAINKKKSSQTSTKGLKEEEKDTTLDAQAAAARARNIEDNQKLDDKEAERQHKLFEGLEKAAEAHAVKMGELNKKMLKELNDPNAYDAITQDMKLFWDGMQENERKNIDEQAKLDEKLANAATSRIASFDLSSVKTSQMELQHSYAMEFSHTLEQQVAYQRQLGDLQAKSLDIKAREAAEAAKAVHTTADSLKATADLVTRQGNIDDKAAITAANTEMLKAKAADLKTTEAIKAAEDARLETAYKIAELIKQQSILGQLQSQVTAAGQSVPASLGGAISGGLMHQGKGGEDIGKQIADAMRNVGKELFGDVLTAAMKQMIESLGLNTLAQNIMHILFGANTTATVANTAATTANTVATGGLLGKLLGAVGIHPKSTPTTTGAGQGGTAVDPQTKYQLEVQIERDMLELDRDLQELDTTDRNLTTAVQQLTDAINQLDGKLGGGSAPSGGGGGGILAGLAGAAAALAGVAGGVALSGGGGGSSGGGEAAGGLSSANVTHLIGENGPELFTPSSSGTIIPNSALGGGGRVRDAHFTINETSSARDTAREIADTMKQLDPSVAAATVPYSS